MKTYKFFSEEFMKTIIIKDNNKTKAMEEARANGFKFSNYRFKKAEVYDYIINHTNCEDLTWKILNTIEDCKNPQKAFEKYQEKAENRHLKRMEAIHL